MTIPIDLTKIHWSGIGISEFQVRGQQAVKDLLAQDATATVNNTQRAEILHDSAAKKVAVVLHIQMQVVAGKPALPLDLSGKFELQLFFEVENLADLLLTVEEQPAAIVHPQLALLVTSIAYSTARGILWTRLAGTPLEGISLPIIEPRSLFLSAPSEVQPAKQPRAKKRNT